jgi:hypothetical protein
MFYRATHSFISQLMAPSLSTMAMIVSENSSSFFGSRVDAVVVPLSFSQSRYAWLESTCNNI